MTPSTQAGHNCGLLLRKTCFMCKKVQGVPYRQREEGGGGGVVCFPLPGIKKQRKTNRRRGLPRHASGFAVFKPGLKDSWSTQATVSSPGPVRTAASSSFGGALITFGYLLLLNLYLPFRRGFESHDTCGS